LAQLTAHWPPVCAPGSRKDTRMDVIFWLSKFFYREQYFEVHQ
jgi:hypothetical protein